MSAALFHALLYGLLLPLLGVLAGAFAGRLLARDGEALNRGVAMFVAILIIGASWLHAWHLLGSLAVHPAGTR